MKEQGFELISASELAKGNGNINMNKNFVKKKKNNESMPDIFIHDPKNKNDNMNSFKQKMLENKSMEESLL